MQRCVAVRVQAVLAVLVVHVVLYETTSEFPVANRSSED